MKCSKSAIPWCDYGASPVTGCRHKCGDQFCYARGMVRRFGKPDVPGLHVLDAPAFEGVDEWTARDVPYPFGWAPTFHRYRLDIGSPRKPGRVFVGPMTDLWGAWVPYEWQDDVLAACAREPRHDYLFLTKNPKAYRRVDWRDKPWAWLGATATDLRAYEIANAVMPAAMSCPHFFSLEPWLGGDDGLDEVRLSLSGGPGDPDWIILGPLTGTRARTAPPVTRDAVLWLRRACQIAGVALYVKPSATAWGLTPAEIASMQAWPRKHPSER